MKDPWGAACSAHPAASAFPEVSTLSVASVHPAGPDHLAASVHSEELRGMQQVRWVTWRFLPAVN